MDRFMHLCNGRELDSEIELGFNGAKCFVRDEYGSPRTTKRIAELRSFGCFFEQMNIDILQTQVFDSDRKMVSGCTQFRNGITYQTNAAIQNICYGMPSLLFHYKQICPGGTIFLGDLTSDIVEQHFNNLKASGGKTIEQLTAAESRGNFHNVLMSSHYATTGIRNISGRRMKRKSNGNSHDATDENVNMMSEAEGDDKSESSVGESQKPKHKRAKLRQYKSAVADLTQPIDYNNDRQKAPKMVKLRQNGKNGRAAGAGGTFVTLRGF